MCINIYWSKHTILHITYYIIHVYAILLWIAALYTFWALIFCVFQEAELESIQMQAQLQSLKEEKERLLNSLVEAE